MINMKNPENKSDEKLKSEDADGESQRIQVDQALELLQSLPSDGQQYYAQDEILSELKRDFEGVDVESSGRSNNDLFMQLRAEMHPDELLQLKP